MEYNICYLIIYLSEAFIFSYYCNKVCDRQDNQFLSYGALIGLYSILFLFSLYKNPYINTGLFISINFVFLFCVVKDKWSSALFHAIISTTAMGLSEVVTFSFFSTMPVDIYSESLVINKIIMLTIISKLLYFLILFFISHAFSVNKKKDSISTSESILLSVIPVLSVGITLSLIAVQSISNIPNKTNYLINFSALAILVINIIIFNLFEYRNIKNNELNETQLLLQKEYDSSEYYKMLLEQDENQKILVHDMKKHLSTIALLISENTPERAISYIDKLLDFSDFKTSVKLCNNDLLNAILGKYQKDCTMNHISFTVDIRNNSIDFLLDNELSALFGNLLDNALEAASKTTEGFIDLCAAYNETSGYTLITMENSCRINPFDKNSIALKTIKQDSRRHGFGMKSIKKIVSNYNGDMRVYYEDEKKSFHTILIMRPSTCNKKISLER